VSERKFVEYKITAKVPKKLNSQLVDLAKFVGISVEEMLTEEMEGLLDSFCVGGYYEAWLERAKYKKGVDC